MATRKSATTARKPATKKATARATSTRTKTTVRTTKTTPVAASSATTPRVHRVDSTSERFSFSRSPLLAASIAEFVGTFLLAAVLLASQGSPVYALFGLIAIVLGIGAVSGAHVNPAITVGAWVTRRVNTARALSYIGSQILGAGLALLLFTAFVSAAPKPEAQQGMTMFGQSPQAAKVFSLPELKKDQGLILATEMLGTGLFAFGVASAMRERNRLVIAFGVGGSLFLGLAIASYLSGVSTGVENSAGPAGLNPAVAAALEAFKGTSWTNLWPLIVYGFAPAVGAVLGFGLRDLLQSESQAETA